jgi:hypothetical protein
MQKFIAFFFLIFFSVSGVAQIRFEQGYFVDNNDQKTACLIRNTGWLNNPSEFKYKLTEQGELMNAEVQGVKEFGVGDLKFIRANVKLDTSEQDLKRVNANRYPQWNERERFLKVMIEGKASLYSYKNSNLEKFFFSVDGSPIEQLVYKIFSPEPPHMVTNLTYLQQLKTRVSCGNISDARLKQIRYDKGPLLKYFESYNACNGQTISTHKIKRHLNLAITPGIDFQRFLLSDTEGKFKKVFPKGTAFRLGISVESFLPFNKGKWSVLAEPTYQSYKSKSPNDAEYTSLEIPLGIRHSFFLNDNSRIFANALFFLDVPIKCQALWDKGLNVIAKSPTPGFAAGLGFNMKRISIEGRKYFSRSVLSSNDSGLFMVYDKFSVIVSYRFNKQ